MTIGNLATLKAFEMISKSGEKMSLARSLSDFVDTQTLLVHHEVLLPGRRAASVHFYSEKEEIFLRPLRHAFCLD